MKYPSYEREYDTLRHVVQFTNIPNNDGSVTDIKFYIDCDIKDDGTVDKFNLIDYTTTTTAMLVGDEAIISTNVSKEVLDKWFYKATAAMYESTEFLTGDNAILDIDAGGSL